MKKSEIIKNINEGNYFYNDNSEWALSFWREAVVKTPNIVISDLKSLIEDTKSDKLYGDPEGFQLNNIYKEIFKNLKIQ